MERIRYAEGSVLTGSAIAKSLLHYAEALARRKTSATVEIPTRKDDGAIGTATFLLGPASQIVSEDEPTEYDEIVDDELVATFDRESALLGVPSVEVDDQPGADDDMVDLDFDDSTNDSVAGPLR